MLNRFSNPTDTTRPNRKWRFIVVGATFVTATIIGELSSWAQPGGGYGRYYGGPITGYYSPGMGGEIAMENPEDPAVKAKMEASQGLANAMSDYRRAQSDAAKAAAQKKLPEVLAKYFDADMKVREANLQKVEAQVKALRSQFDKRASKKQEILDLQLKLVQNESEGLGFFGISPGHQGNTGYDINSEQINWPDAWGTPAPSPTPIFNSNAPGEMAPVRATSPQPRPLDAPPPRQREAQANSPIPAE